LKRIVFFLACTALGLCELGCKNETKTDLVKRVEAQGSPDLASTSTDAMKKWFAAHPKLAAGILPECQKIRTTAPAKWNDSTEGRVCQAASFGTAFGGVDFYPTN
jgi:hypothetical protein